MDVSLVDERGSSNVRSVLAQKRDEESCVISQQLDFVPFLWLNDSCAMSVPDIAPHTGK